MVSLRDDLDSGCGCRGGCDRSGELGGKREFRAIYRDIVLVEKEKEKTFFGESVEEKIDSAMEIFEALEKYEGFRKNHLIEK